MQPVICQEMRVQRLRVTGKPPYTAWGGRKKAFLGEAGGWLACPRHREERVSGIRRDERGAVEAGRGSSCPASRTGGGSQPVGDSRPGEGQPAIQLPLQANSPSLDKDCGFYSM